MDSGGPVVVLGDSLLMDSVRTTLQNGLAHSIVQVDPLEADIGGCLKFFRPELIVFELDSSPLYAILSLLREQPNTLLLGIDGHCSQVIALNGRQHLIEDMEGFCQLAQAELDRRAHIWKGGPGSDKYSSSDDCID
jgi:hypothetical protein